MFGVYFAPSGHPAKPVKQLVGVGFWGGCSNHPRGANNWPRCRSWLGTFRRPETYAVLVPLVAWWMGIFMFPYVLAICNTLKWMWILFWLADVGSGLKDNKHVLESLFETITFLTFCSNWPWLCLGSLVLQAVAQAERSRTGGCPMRAEIRPRGITRASVVCFVVA